jgi:hypothetical protein
MPIFAICESAYWNTPNWAGKGSEAGRDAYYDGTYTSCTAWEAGRDGAAAGGTTETGEIVGPWNADDTNAFSIFGWNSTTTIILKALGSSRHSGTYDASSPGPHRLVASSTTTLINMAESNLTVEGMQLRNAILGDADSQCLQISQEQQDKTIRDCMLVIAGDGESVIIGSATAQCVIFNCVCYSEGGGSEGIFVSVANAVDIWNCTIDNFQNGIERDDGTVTAKNCAVLNSSGDDFNGTVTVDYCASDDGTGTNAQTLDSTNNYQDEFNDQANNDYNMISGSICVGNGVDDPGSGEYSDDIIDVARNSTWDIGAFELAAVGGIVVLRRRRM